VTREQAVALLESWLAETNGLGDGVDWTHLNAALERYWTAHPRIISSRSGATITTAGWSADPGDSDIPEDERETFRRDVSYGNGSYISYEYLCEVWRRGRLYGGGE